MLKMCKTENYTVVEDDKYVSETEPKIYNNQC